MATINVSEHRRTESAPELEQWVDLHGDYLYRYALAHVHDRHVAEDLLQETFLGALRGYSAFEHKAALRTWLTSILQRKIVDYFRTRARAEKAVGRTQADSATDQARPDKWNVRPEKTLENREFWGVLQTCLRKLPETLALAFTLREIDGLESDSVCETLEISGQNLAVRIYRARLALRDCLNLNWFMKD